MNRSEFFSEGLKLNYYRHLQWGDLLEKAEEKSNQCGSTMVTKPEYIRVGHYRWKTVVL